MTDESIRRIPFQFAKRHGVLLTGIENHSAKIVYSRIPTISMLAELRRYFDMPILLEQVSEEIFGKLLVTHYETDSNTAMLMAEDLGESFNLRDLMQEIPKAEDLLETQDDAPIIRLLNALLSEAIKESASDIHIETFENRVMVRFRIDGVLREILEPQRILAPLIISRIKVMAKLDIAEKRLPQDGRITLRIAGRAVDVRVSTMPTSHGERVVLRLLDKQTARLDLTHLGMEQNALSLMKKLIATPHGIILVTGPTGSGKTTTLYAALTALNNQTRNILTVEDPIEFDLPGIGQTQVNSKVNMTFAKGLRAILRQDPDVVMVGEIRDLETAQIAIQASLTGHLVLSTLHTNSAIGAITRLNDMGIESFLLSSSLLGVLAQRLLRLLCSHCKKAAPATKRELTILATHTITTDIANKLTHSITNDITNKSTHSITNDIANKSTDSSNQDTILYHPVGCHLCRNTGYSGRTGIYELIAIDDSLRTMIHEHQPEQIIKKYARNHYLSMRQDGFRRVLNGDTSLEEVLRVTNEE